MSKQRSSYNYTFAEDIHLAQLWLDVSHDPIVGNNQPRARFWERIAEKYNTKKPNSKISDRNKRLVQCRMQLIHKECKRLNGCLRQVELLNPSGENEQNIYQLAHEMFISIKGCEEGFKYDHVWPTIKEFVQSQVQTNGGVSSDLDENMMESPTSPPPFTINLSEDNNFSDGSPSQRPEGVKKSKLKRKQGEEMSSFLQMIKEENEKLRGLLESSVEKSDRCMDMLQKKLEADQEKNRIRQQVRDGKIMNISPNSIEDPERRTSLMFEQQVIMQKRRQAHIANTSSSVYHMFGQFPDLGGSGSGLSEY